MEPVPLLDCAGRRRSPATLFNFHQDTCPATRVHADVGMSPSCAAEDLGGSRAWSPANGGGRRHRAALDSMNPPLVGLMMLLFESRRRYAGRRRRLLGARSRCPRKRGILEGRGRMPEK